MDHPFSYRPMGRHFQISTGNKGVDQLSIKFFSMCGIAPILFPLILALFCMTGCLEKAPEFPMLSSEGREGQAVVPRLQMDFDAELRCDLFGVRGNIVLPANSTLAYLMLNATLEGEEKQFCTKYLLMQLEPNRDYSFEIARNVKIPAGEYNCTLEAKGPVGVLAKETRRCHLEEPVSSPPVELIYWPQGSLPAAAPELPQKIADESSPEAEIADGPDESRGFAKESNAAKEDPKAKEEAEDISTGTDLIGADLTLPASSTSLQEDARFVGSATSKKYHRPDCRYALKIKPENLIYFQSEEDAKGQGYLPCKSCNP